MTRVPVAVAPKLSRPPKKFLAIESEVFADLHVRHRICSSSLVEPTLRDPEQSRRFVNRQQAHVMVFHGADEGGLFASRR